MKCKLCNEEKDLINAHLIPKWAYKHIAKVDNKYDLILVEKGKQKRAPIGTYDQNILCKECDNFIGEYDDYAKKVILDKELKKVKEAFYIIKDVDIERFAIFLLSVAWRESISTKDESGRVKIGPYEDKIRNILIDRRSKNNKLSISDYSFVLGKFKVGKLPDLVVNKNIQIPHSQKIQGVNVFVLYLPGAYKIYLKLDQRQFPSELERLFRAYSDSLPVLSLKEYSESDEFKSMLKVV